MEPATPTSPHGTDFTAAIILRPASEITARDNQQHDDLVALYLDGDPVTIMGDLATVERIIDDAARQLALIRLARANAAEECDERERGLAGVADLRQVAQDARGTAGLVGANDTITAVG